MPTQGDSNSSGAKKATSKTKTAKAPKKKGATSVARSGAGDAPAVASRPKAKRAPAIESRTGRVAIIGRANVGKSTLLNTLLGEPIAITSRHPQTTRDQILGVLTEGDTQFVFVDTPGLHEAKTRLGARMNSTARDASRDADVILFMTDLAPEPKPDLRAADKAILLQIPKSTPVILLINKVDRIKDKSALFPVLTGHSKAREFAAVIPISALNGGGRENILRELRERLPIGPKLFEDDALSDRPVRFFVAEFVREQILRKTYQEVPHGVAVTVERFEESKAVPHIDLAIVVDRESHKRIVIGAGGSLLKEIGTEARARVEAMLGRQVHLQLWVRVTPKWYESEQQLRELGYSDGEKRSNES